jgi:hypothetical protein
MKLSIFAAAAATAFLLMPNTVLAQTKSERCAAYARDAARSTPTTTGAARGAARGAVGGAIFGDAGKGAATGAIVGGTRKVAQRSRSYQYYYDRCMRG